MSHVHQIRSLGERSADELLKQARAANSVEELKQLVIDLINRLENDENYTDDGFERGRD